VTRNTGYAIASPIGDTLRPNRHRVISARRNAVAIMRQYRLTQFVTAGFARLPPRSRKRLLAPNNVVRHIFWAWFLLLLLLPARSAPKEDDFPTKFTVLSSEISRSRCAMSLEREGTRWVYQVTDRATFHCHAWQAGTILRGKISDSKLLGSFLSILNSDDKGKPKVYHYVITDISSI
jgi:hypothetical protein